MRVVGRRRDDADARRRRATGARWTSRGCSPSRSRHGAAAIGALVCARLAGPPFTRAERALLGSVAAQAATAVVGARGAMRGLFAQEIHHRVKNNLQTVASLLRLAATGGGDPQRALRDSIGRVLSIAEVHDLLTSTHEEDVDSADLVRRLHGDAAPDRGRGHAETALAPIVLRARPRDGARPGLCELAANAIEHGGGVRNIVLRRDGAFAQLTVSDAGPGPAPTAGERRRARTHDRTCARGGRSRRQPAVHRRRARCARDGALPTRGGSLDARAGLRGRDDHPARPRASCSRAAGFEVVGEARDGEEACASPPSSSRTSS